MTSGSDKVTTQTVRERLVEDFGRYQTTSRVRHALAQLDRMPASSNIVIEFVADNTTLRWDEANRSVVIGCLTAIKGAFFGRGA